MINIFATVSLSFDDKAPPDHNTLAAELKRLGLTRELTSTEGRRVDLPNCIFAGHISGEDRMDIHRDLHRGLNAVLKKLAIHGKFFIETSLDQDWSCCHF